ncbi:type III polyketide synthase [Halomonas sp. WWR20]
MAANAILQGLGVATPAGTLDQTAAAEIAETRCCANERQRKALRRIYRYSGVQRRSSVLLCRGDADDAGPADNEGIAGFEAFFPPAASADDYGPPTADRLQRYAKDAGPLAATACRAALAEAATEPATITHVVTVSCTGMVAPGLDSELIQRLGLSVDVGRLNLGFMGCHGALNGLRTASALAQQDSRARILLCCVELCTLHFRYGWDLEKIVANSLFADGAGAVVLGQGERADSGWRLLDTASRLAPSSTDAMTWKIGNHGFEMTLSSEVPRLIRGALREWLEPWLAGHGMTLRDVAHWAIHPGGPEIIRAVTQALELPEDADRDSRAVLAEHGNMSSPTVLFVLERLRRRAAHGPCVMLGFGPGLSMEAALLV